MLLWHGYYNRPHQLGNKFTKETIFLHNPDFYPNCNQRAERKSKQNFFPHFCKYFLYCFFREFLVRENNMSTYETFQWGHLSQKSTKIVAISIFDYLQFT